MFSRALVPNRSRCPAARADARRAASCGSACAISTPSTHDAARPRIVEAQQQLEHRALAGARRADERDRLAGRDVEREIVERAAIRDATDSGTSRCSKRDARRDRRRETATGCGGATIAGVRVQQFHQPLHRAGRALHFAPHLAERGGGDRRRTSRRSGTGRAGRRSSPSPARGARPARART